MIIRADYLIPWSAQFLILAYAVLEEHESGDASSKAMKDCEEIFNSIQGNRKDLSGMTMAMCKQYVEAVARKALEIMESQDEALH